MKVVQINAVYEYSSTGRTTTEMHEFMLNQGVESYVFCSNKHMPEKNVFQVGHKLDYKFHSLMSHLTDSQGLHSRCSTKQLLKQLERIQPDIVILRNLHANYIHYPSLLTYLAKNDIVTIVVLHDVWTFTGHCCYYTEDNCNKWLTGCSHCPALGKYNKSWLVDNSAANYKRKFDLFRAIPRLAVIGVSQWVAEEAKRSPIFANAKLIDYIYNWIDLSKFKPVDGAIIREKLRLGDRFTTVSCAQEWSERKGVFTIIDVAKQMPEERFVLLGKMAYNGELPPNVISVGVTASVAELAQYYSMADALLVCSIQETFGKVSAEALACGTPVITNHSTANPEIAGEDCGLLFENNNVDEIVVAIRSLKASGKTSYRDKCLRRVREEFNFELQTAKYVKLFEDMILKNSRNGNQ